MILASDNWAGASDRVAAAIAAVAAAPAPAYGADDITKRVERRFADLFETEVAVFFVATGTAANALALAAFAAPGGIVICHADAHIATDEAGAVPFYGGGLTLRTLAGTGGRLAPADVTEALAHFDEAFVHLGRPIALSISHLTEWGQVYSPGDIATLAGIAHRRGMGVHMDGARFATALAATGERPADVTWRAGVDILSFGGTKNGCLMAEAVVVFDPARGRDVAFARQRAGHGFSKNWLAAAQFDAYLANGHWLDLARKANAAAAELAAAIRATPGAELVLEPPANQVFARITAAQERALKAAGIAFYRWPPEAGATEAGPDAPVTVRLVTSFQTGDDEAEAFAHALVGAR